MPVNRTSPIHPGLLILLVLLAFPPAAAAQQLHTHIYGPQDGLVSSGLTFLGPPIRPVAGGYSDDAVMADPGAHGFAAALVKPFDRDRLMAALDRAVKGPADECP